MALAALELGKRRRRMPSATPATSPWQPPFRDDKEGGHGVVDMYRSIVVSCDTYYYMLANDMGVNAIHDFMKPFGFGQITGIDLEHEKRGILPSTEWKRNAFRKPEQKVDRRRHHLAGHRPGLQQLHPAAAGAGDAILANNGVVMKPHLVKIIEDGVSRERTETVPKLPHPAEAGKHRLHQARHGGRGQGRDGRCRLPGAPYESGGKTGTAQVVNIAKNQKYDSKKLTHLP
jgi:penicillin-binding protein 2